MTVTAEVLDAMLAAGLSAEQIVKVTKAALAAQEAAAEDRRAAKRANNAERQQRWRDKRKVTAGIVTQSNALSSVTERDAPLQVPLPLITPSPPISPQGESEIARARASDWPDDYREQVWKAYGQGREKKAGMAKLAEVRKAGRVAWQPLMAAIRRQSETVEPQFRPSLERFLKRERWLDDYEPEATGPPFEARPMQRSLKLVNGNHAHAQAPKPDVTDILRARIAARESG